MAEAHALHGLAERLRGLEVSAAGYDPAEYGDPDDDAAWAYESLADMIDWAYRQQARLTGGGER